MIFTDPYTDESFTFPVPLSPDLNRVVKQLGLADIACYSRLNSIDDVDDLIQLLRQLPPTNGDEPIDDLYHLCVRIRSAWQAQYRYQPFTSNRSKPMKFRLLHCEGTPHEGNDWGVHEEFADVHKLFDFDPNMAAWFAQHPRSSYYQFDHGDGLHWRYERVW